MSGEEPVVALREISKKYILYNNRQDRLKEALHPFKKIYHHDFFALKNINLRIKRGEILGIVGRNGSGKSTLLKIIAKVITPTEGSVAVTGKIAAIFELGSCFNPEFTGIENISFFCTILGYRRDEIDQIKNQIIEFSELGEYIFQPIKTYSSGMKARLSFAVSVHINPDILILDEVLAVGDDLFKRKCHARMEQFFKGGKTILFVSHDVNSVNLLCTRAILLDKGEILLQGPPKLVTMYYQKLIYAREEHHSSVLDEICELDKNEKRKEIFDLTTSDAMPFDFDCQGKENTTNQAASDDLFENQGFQPYYLPAFLSQTIVELRNFDVTIYDCEIVTEDGKRVNVLVQGQRYCFQYKVLFNAKLDNIQFSNSIKTQQGQDIAWFMYPDKNNFLNQAVSEGMIMTYKMLFDCLLIGGKSYYINIGLRTFMNNENLVVSRIVDAYVFRVISDDKSGGGIVSLNQKTIIE